MRTAAIAIERTQYLAAPCLKKRIAILPLLAAAGIGVGCATSKEAAPAEIAQISCIERAAVTQSPGHPLLELTKCIVATDDMTDPDHLYKQVLRINDYSKVSQKWGLQVFSDSRNLNFNSLPIGIKFIDYTKSNRDEKYHPGRRRLHMGLKKDQSCVSLDQATDIFGENFKFIPDLAIPNPASPNLQNKTPTPWQRETNIYGVEFFAPDNSKGDFITILLIFGYQKCALDISIVRNTRRENQ
ncbi:MAG: hypothetical protein JSS56_05065 [Proteobacteria bacterium]|nr:hypothetical protein [Pseudomonadota bacterium]